MGPPPRAYGQEVYGQFRFSKRDWLPKQCNLWWFSCGGFGQYAGYRTAACSVVDKAGFIPTVALKEGHCKFVMPAVNLMSLELDLKLFRLAWSWDSHRFCLRVWTAHGKMHWGGGLVQDGNKVVPVVNTTSRNPPRSEKLTGFVEGRAVRHLPWLTSLGACRIVLERHTGSSLKSMGCVGWGWFDILPVATIASWCLLRPTSLAGGKGKGRLTKITSWQNSRVTLGGVSLGAMALATAENFN